MATRRRLPSLAATNGIDPVDHDRLVFVLAKKYGARPPVRDSEQYANGWLGLMRAVDRFDPRKGFTFATYASYWVKAAIMRPWRAQQTQSRGRGAYELSLSQISEEAQLATELTSRDPDGCDRSASNERAAIATDLLRFIDERTRRMVERRWIDGWTLEAIGDAEGVSRERVRQITGRGMRMLRVVAESRGIKAEAV